MPLRRVSSLEMKTKPYKKRKICINKKQQAMKGISFVTNDKGEKVGLMIDLKNHDKVINEYLEDLFDLIDINSRKDEGSLPWDEVKKGLQKDGVID